MYWQSACSAGVTAFALQHATASQQSHAMSVSKVAVTEAVVVRVHAAMPEQAPPLQPVKRELLSGIAVSVTWLPTGHVFVQAPGHAMPLGFDVTSPVPVPAVCTDTENAAMQALPLQT